MDHLDQTSRPDDGSAGDAPAIETLLPPAGNGVDGSGDADSRHSVLSSAFLGELAKAMHGAADQEGERLATVIADEAAMHVERTRARATVETEELRRLADEDLAQIKQWAATEMGRIRDEAARRADERRSTLDQYILQHDTIIEAEIEGLGTAVAGYRATLRAFFAELTASNDPAEIARRAGTLPPPPVLEEVRASARGQAVARFAESEAAEPAPLVGVMDPSAIGESSEPGNGVAAQADGANGTDAAVPTESSDEPAEPVAVGAAADHPGAAIRLLRSFAPWTAPSHADDRPASETSDEDRTAH